MAIVFDKSGNSLFTQDKTNARFVAVDITPSDTVNNDRAYRRIMASVAGNAVIVRGDGSTQTFALVAGVWTEIGPFVRVNSTSTTATGLKAAL